MPGRPRSRKPSDSSSRSPERAQRVRAFGFLLIGIIGFVYVNSLSNAFVYDDRFAIRENRSIESISAAFHPSADSPVAGRPIANVSFALSYALGGREPAAFRLGNVLIHAAAALLLFGIVRRTLETDRVGLKQAALPLAFLSAALWAVHPLQSEVVDYVTQRTESLAGALFLLTLYAAIRSARSQSTGWELLSVCA